MLNALTVDIEDYFMVSAFSGQVEFCDWSGYESRVENNTLRILDMLDEFNTKATFFILGWVAERTPKLVHEIQRHGHEIGSHGYSHKRVYTQSISDFRQETHRSKQVLEDITGQPVEGYRAASYSITNKSLWALDVLLEENFLYDSSIFPVWHDLYGIPHSPRFVNIIKRPSGTITEYPISTIRFGKINIPIGGGGYLRLFPYNITKWAVERLNRIEQQPAIVYFHPWEIDPDQPRIKGGLVSKFRHYTNLKQTEVKLRKLLNDFSFVPMRELPTNSQPPVWNISDMPQGNKDTNQIDDRDSSLIDTADANFTLDKTIVPSKNDH